MTTPEMQSLLQQELPWQIRHDLLLELGLEPPVPSIAQVPERNVEFADWGQQLLEPIIWQEHEGACWLLRRYHLRRSQALSMMWLWEPLIIEEEVAP